MSIQLSFIVIQLFIVYCLLFIVYCLLFKKVSSLEFLVYGFENLKPETSNYFFMFIVLYEIRIYNVFLFISIYFIALCSLFYVQKCSLFRLMLFFIFFFNKFSHNAYCNFIGSNSIYINANRHINFFEFFGSCNIF